MAPATLLRQPSWSLRQGRLRTCPRAHCSPPKDDPFTPEELAQFDGTDPSKPVYVAVKEPGKGYSVFAGKDGSRGLGMSSLKPEDAVSDYSTLDEKQMKVLDDWRYNIVGKVVVSKS